MFYQPWMLWVLPAVLLPLIIHLLNRLRYKTVPWAAMMFLLKANKSATRRAKIRQWLLLASRMLLLLFFLYGMARPLVGGWLGASAGGAPEAVVILLDRSASMEASGPDKNISKRAHALNLLAEAAKNSAGSRFVVIENVLRTPTEVATGEALRSLAVTSATDTAAHLPSLFLAAVEYLSKNRPGSAEIWVASDFQESSWQPNPADWADLKARFGGLPQAPRVRILDLSSPVQNNVSLALKNVDLTPSKEKGAKLSVAVEVRSTGQTSTVPLSMMRDGARSQQDLALTSATQRQVLKLDLAEIPALGGYGQISVPADENSADGQIYYVYAAPTALTTLVVSKSASALPLRFSAAPDPNRADRKTHVVTAENFSTASLKETALILWQDGAVSPTQATALHEFVSAGGVLVFFPAGNDAVPNIMGLTWKAAEPAPAEGPFRVTSWDEVEGPMAKTDNGTSLALADVECGKRQIPVMEGDATRLYGSFADGQAFLLGKRHGAGAIYACATAPEAAWSNLGQSLVLLPMVQRFLAAGAARLVPPQMGIAGEWQPADAQQTWSPLKTAESPSEADARNWRWNAGIYESGTQRIALNRPASEDAPEVLTGEQVKNLLSGLEVDILAQAMDVKANRLQNEIWPMLVMGAMLFMIAEMALATSKGLLPQKARVAPASPKNSPAAA